MMCCLITLASGTVYMEYSTGPKTESCGTKYFETKARETFVLNINKLGSVQKIRSKPSESLASDSKAMIKPIE